MCASMPRICAIVLECYVLLFWTCIPSGSSSARLVSSHSHCKVLKLILPHRTLTHSHCAAYRHSKPPYKPHSASRHKTRKRKPTQKWYVLSRFETRFNPDKTKRAHNLRLAAKRVNGKMIPPGHVFSVNAVVGPRTHQNGFLTAPVIEHRKLVAGIGGGVSQVSGTLFNAALLADLAIVEFHNHAEPVAYLPIGHDATVAWNHLDMRFKNTTHTPMRLLMKVHGSHLIAVVLAQRPSGVSVQLRAPSKKVGPHHLKAQLYRIVKKRGKLVKKELIGREDYDWKPQTPD